MVAIWLFEFGHWLGLPVFGELDTGTRLDPLIENSLALLGKLFMVYLLGLLSAVSVVARRIVRLERLPASLIPGYTWTKRGAVARSGRTP